ncbi:MAG: L-rhamnose mutarotase [bacterium]
MRSFLLFAIILISSCSDQSNVVAERPVEKNIVRYGMVTGLKPEKMDYYNQLHAEPWPSITNLLTACNIGNYSIFLQKIKDEYYLFSYFEYSGTDYDADMKKIAADTAMQRWWKETDPCQLPLEEALAKHQIWTPMQSVFFLK